MQTVDIQRLKSGEVNLGVCVSNKFQKCLYRLNAMIYYDRPRSWPFNSKVVSSLVLTRGRLPEATLYVYMTAFMQAECTKEYNVPQLCRPIE